MERPGRCGGWLDTATATATAQSFTLQLDTTSEGGDCYLATSGDFPMATDTKRARPQNVPRQFPAPSCD
jgi:hypothetical protein